MAVCKAVRVEGSRSSGGGGLEPFPGEKGVWEKAVTGRMMTGHLACLLCVSVKLLPPTHRHLSADFQAEFEGKE